MNRRLFMIIIIIIVAVAGAAPLALQGAPATPPPGWRETMQKYMDLTLAGKELEAVALFEKFVAQHPNFVEGHFMLAGAHESVARATFGSGAPDAAKTRAKYFESAIVLMRRALEMAGPNVSFDWVRGYIDIHGVVGVNRPAEYERLVRDAVVRYPAEPYAHAYLLALLAQKGEPIDAAARAARATIPRTADARSAVAGSLASHVSNFRALMPAAGVNALLGEAMAFADEAVKLNPKDAHAMRTKARLEELRKVKF